MRLTKSTTILLNVVLVLLALLLIKSLITLPKNLYANNSFEYSVTTLSIGPSSRDEQNQAFSDLLNNKAKEGWKFHSVVGDHAIFER